MTGIVVMKSLHWWAVITSLALTVITFPCECVGRVITVSEMGNDSLCLQYNASVPCLLLDHAVLALNESNTTIEVYYSHNFSESVHLHSTAHNLTIRGMSKLISIHCTQRGDGLAFSHQSSVTIQGISWINCASLHTSTAMSAEIFSSTDFINIFSGLLFYNVTHLTVDRCLFTTQGGVGLALFDIRGHVNILNTSFINNSIASEYQCSQKPNNVSNSTVLVSCSPLGGGLYIELTRCGFNNCSSYIATVQESTYIIDQCTFQSNNKPAAYIDSPEIILGLQETWWPFGEGAGMALNVRGENKDNRVLITNTIFDRNVACNGGGALVSLSDNTTNNTVEFLNVTFASNKAKHFDGGGIRTVQHSGESGRISFTNVTFINNSALSGGGVDHVLTHYGNRSHDCVLSTVYFYNCLWHNNTASKAGAAVQVLHVDITVATTIGKAYFHNAVFQGNAIPRPNGHIVHYGQGALYSLGVQVEFSGETIINSSVGTAVVISSTELTLGGDVLLSNNHGLQGGALFLDGVSWLTLRQGLNLTFQNNHAFEAGAAIYYTYKSSRTFNISSTCFVQYEDGALPPSEWDVSVSFSGNEGAPGGGNAVHFTGTPDCYWLGEGFLFKSPEGKFNFSENQAPVISTSVNNISLDTKYVGLVDGFYIVDLMPGEELFIPVTVMDYFNSKTTATLDAKCYNYTLYTQNRLSTDACNEETDFRFYGSRVLTINNTLSGITLGGPRKNSDMMIVFKTLEAQPLIFSLRINFTDCENGYMYDETSKSCKCYDNGEGIMRCFTSVGNTTTQIPCIRIGYWFGRIPSQNNTHITASCPASVCRTQCFEHCMNIDGWCKLPGKSADLCINHHSGPLCALCKPGYSLGYDGILCIPNSDCNTRSTVLLLFFIVLFWVVIITGLLFTFRVNFRIGSGYIYAFVYYFSILPYVSSSNLQNQGFNAFVAVFLGVVHLDPEFLSYTNLCFDAKWDFTQIQMTFFHYIHPVCIGTIIYLLLFLNRRCCRSIFTQSSLIHILCIILLLSYTSLFQTSINLIVPITFNGHPYVRIQPNTKYGDPTGHLPYLLVAIIVECVLIIPFAVVLLLAPWMMRWRICTRLKPIIDEYQACYRSRYRWFAGYYLINRQLVALTVSIFTNQSSIVLSQQFLNTSILLFHAYIQPYKEKWLNVLDTAFLLDLTLLSFLSGPAASNTFNTASSLTTIRVLQYFLIIIPCLYFVIACIVIISIRVRMWCNERKQKVRWGPFVWQETIPQRRRPFRVVQDAEEYDELVDETLSVEMSSHTRETLGNRGDRLITHARTTKDYSNTNSDEVYLIPPSSSTPTLLQKAVGSLSSKMQYWRHSRTLSEDSARENQDILNSDRSSLQ